MGVRITPHQLLRWHQAGLLPQPRREGLGRGKGTVSYYNKQALYQSWALADLLRRRRNLTEAGWGVWMWGFPVTDWARDLLVRELTRERRAAARVKRMVGSDQIGVPYRLGLEASFSLGTLQSTDYTEDQWDDLQAELIEELWPKRGQRTDDPTPRQVAANLAELARHINLPRAIAELKALSKAKLEQYRNEAQWLFEQQHSLVEGRALMPRDEFVRFFQARHLVPGQGAAFEKQMLEHEITHSPDTLFRREWNTLVAPHLPPSS